MEHLTKQQIVLLTLFTSFVTSIATGIVTVSLMGQAPVGVTQTINRVVERTIEKVVTDSSATTSTAASISAAIDLLSKTVDKVSQSVIRIKPSGVSTNEATGLGLIVSSNGAIVTDKAAVAPQGNLMALFSNGEEYPIQVIQSQINGDIVFAVAVMPDAKKAQLLKPVTFAGNLKLGQAVFALSGKDLDGLTQGVLHKIPDSSQPVIQSSVSASDLLVGSPLFTATGEVIGFKTSSLEDSFSSLNNLKQSIPSLSR